MKRTVRLFESARVPALLAAALFVASAQTLAWAQGGGSRAPRFEDYPAGRIYRGPVAPVRLDSRRARMFRTRLREDSRAGPNFAGRYTFVLWGCGTGCAESAVVDAVTGRVFFTPLDYHDILSIEDEQERRRYFRLDSRLLVITRALYGRHYKQTAYYYLFDGRRFRLLRKVVEQQVDPEEPETQN